MTTRPEPAQAASRRAQAGFTITELLVVILIIGLLATVVLINVLPALDQSRVTKAQADIASLEQALEQYRLDMSRYPTTEEGLEALITVPVGAPQAERYRDGGYVRRLPEDPWGEPYRYVFPGEQSVFDLYSLGADGRRGGEGLDADIGNWRS